MPPPGAGVDTSIVADVPLVVRSAAGISITSCPELRNEVANGVPSHSANELCAKPPPDNRTSRSDDPAEALDGDRDESDGAGLLEPVIGKFIEAEPTTNPGV